jgi:hypothetical protein
MMNCRPALASLALAAALQCTSAVAGPRAFVASTGDDANTAANCAPTALCRTFSAAQSVVDAGGEIIALDAADYGAITITKSVSIIGNPGVDAAIEISSGTAVTIATPSVDVTLKGLRIKGLYPNTTGIDMTSGSRLAIENCVLNSHEFAIRISAPALVMIADTEVRGGGTGISAEGGATVDISRVQASEFNYAGIQADSSPTGNTTVAVSDSVLSGNGEGVAAGAGYLGAIAMISVTRSTLWRNNYGVYALVHTDSCGYCGATALITIGDSMVTNSNLYGFYSVGGTIETLGTNILRGSAFGTIITVPGG